MGGRERRRAAGRGRGGPAAVLLLAGAAAGRGCPGRGGDNGGDQGATCGKV